MDIVALLQCLQPYVPATTLRRCGRIVRALLVMPGRITMLGMSRWAGQGGSYRTIQRFFATVLPWGLLFWVFFRHHLYCPDDVYLVAGDDVIVTKAGTRTHGLDRFFASLYGKPVPGLAFFTLSLVSVQARRAFPLRVEQVVRSDVEKAARKAKAAAWTAQGQQEQAQSRQDLHARITYHPQSGWFEDTPLQGGTEEGCPLKGVHEGTFLIEAGHPAWNYSRASGLTVVL